MGKWGSCVPSDDHYCVHRVCVAVRTDVVVGFYGDHKPSECSAFRRS